MKLSFGVLSVDRARLDSSYDVLLGVVADFSIEIGGRLFLREEMFPVLELHKALSAWLTDYVRGDTHDFVFESMEADGALLSFLYGDGSSRVESPLHHGEPAVVANDELVRAVTEYLRGVEAAATSLGLTSARWLTTN